MKLPTTIPALEALAAEVAEKLQGLKRPATVGTEFYVKCRVVQITGDEDDGWPYEVEAVDESNLSAWISPDQIAAWVASSSKLAPPSGRPWAKRKAS